MLVKYISRHQQIMQPKNKAVDIGKTITANSYQLFAGLQGKPD